MKVNTTEQKKTRKGCQSPNGDKEKQGPLSRRAPLRGKKRKKTGLNDSSRLLATIQNDFQISLMNDLVRKSKPSGEIYQI